jgi:hypothetical protein
MTKTPAYLTTALALAKAAKTAGVPRLARWGERQDDQDPTVRNPYPFVKTGD